MIKITTSVQFSGISNGDIKKALKEELEKHGLFNVDVNVSSSGEISIDGNPSDVSRASEILSGDSGIDAGHTLKPHHIDVKSGIIKVGQTKTVVRNASEQNPANKKPKQ